MEVAADEQRCTELQMAACKRELADCSSLQLKLNAQLDGVQGQLAVARRELSQQREHTRDARDKMAAMDATHEQLLEEAASKEKQVINNAGSTP